MKILNKEKIYDSEYISLKTLEIYDQIYDENFNLLSPFELESQGLKSINSNKKNNEVDDLEVIEGCYKLKYLISAIKGDNSFTGDDQNHFKSFSYKGYTYLLRESSLHYHSDEVIYGDAILFEPDSELESNPSEELSSSVLISKKDQEENNFYYSSDFMHRIEYTELKKKILSLEKALIFSSGESYSRNEIARSTKTLIDEVLFLSNKDFEIHFKEVKDSKEFNLIKEGYCLITEDDCISSKENLFYEGIQQIYSPIQIKRILKDPLKKTLFIK